MKLWVTFAFLALTACDALPQDPDGTLDRVRTTHRLRIGVVTPAIAPEAKQLIAAVARQTGAAPVLRHGSLEPMLVDLDADRLDLVIADVAKRTPWKTLVAPGPPLATRGAGKERIELRALMKNGENKWIMLVEKTSRQIADQPS
jgi:hypothetical protein